MKSFQTLRLALFALAIVFSIVTLAAVPSHDEGTPDVPTPLDSLLSMEREGAGSLYDAIGSVAAGSEYDD